MADDWQPGDLALCVADRLPAPRDKRSTRLRVGARYTVTTVRWSIGEQCVALGLAEVRSNGPLGDWHAQVFRKVTPDEADEFDRETIALLTGKPAKVSA